MHLTVLGSGSRGNSLFVESAGAALLVDAGFGWRDLARRCAGARCDTSLIRAIAVTHEHGDHTRGLARAAAAWRVPVAASSGTLEALARRLPDSVPVMSLLPGRPVALGSFTLTGYPTAHDAAEPIVLVVEDSAGRRLGVAYDAGSPTTALQHALRGLDALVIETNHDEIMLRSSSYPPSVRARIAGRGGHLSNSQAAALVAQGAHAALEVVVLAHLSDRCNRPELALAAMRTALRGTAFRGRLVVAGQDGPTAPVAIGAGLEQLALPLGRGR